MKVIIPLLAIGALCSCAQPKQDAQQMLSSEISKGNFSRAEAMLDSLIAQAGEDFSKVYEYTFKKDSLYKVRKEFRRTKEEVVEYIKRYYPEDYEKRISDWIANGVLEYRVIDSDTLFFRNAAPNVFRVDMDAAKLVDVGDDGGRPLDSVLNVNIPEILKAKSGELAAPKRMRARFSIKVQADAVPAGDTLRAWIPIPRTDIARQKDFVLLGSSDSCVIAPFEYAHHSAYMQKPAVAGMPTEFFVEYEYTAYGQHFDLEGVEIAPYDTNSDVYKTYTAVREPHLIQSEGMKKLATEIVGDEKNPYQKVKKIFEYVRQYPWASALNYSIITDIPQYVIDNKKGDCGQVGLTFINLARAAGIPARWESGLMFHPKSVNMHDWAEVYYEGIGWVPLDVSFGRNKAITNEGGGLFFNGGIDSYRMVANSDYGRDFFPAKKFPRSETVDFQAGEVETSKGNLYYDKWSWNVKVEYLD